MVDAMRQAARGGLLGIVGSIVRIGEVNHEGGVAGASVVARSEFDRYAAVADGDGKYEIRGLVPGRYQLAVTKPGSEGDFSYSTKRPREAVGGKGNVGVQSGTCAVLQLGLWSDGQISGRVTGPDGLPICGIEVAAFPVGRKGVQRSEDWKIARTTDGERRYRLNLLPGAPIERLGSLER